MPIYKPMRGTGWRRGYLSGPFSPNQISGLKLWLAADAGTYQDTSFLTLATADGSSVGGWKDLSGNGNNASQGTGASKPTLKTNIQNGKPVIRFDGIDDYIETVAFSAAPQPLTFFYVYTLRATTNGQVMVDGLSVGHEAGAFFISSAILQGYAGFSNGLGTTAPDLLGHVVMLEVNVASSKWRIDGGSDTAFGTSLGSEDMTGRTIGSFLGGAGGSFCSMDFAELLAYSGILSASSKRNVFNYLNGRWGIY